MKPFSDPCERNKGPILAVLREAFSDCRAVLEIGSGTGQHAVHFAAALPHLTWQTSDLPVGHPGILAWLEEYRLPNVLPPLALDVNRFDWPEAAYDGVFSANTAHILSWQEVELLFRGIGRTVKPGGWVCLYGPFNYGGRFTSESNRLFDASLRARDPLSGIRDFERVHALAREQGLTLVKDHAMPTNNRTLVWRKPAV
ncbi:MAG: DUF938 domain-containing protein [Betaproteobacteria bacterium]|nr:DUF938 domain-containing protein [Betaproteobacteria bacterium]